MNPIYLSPVVPLILIGICSGVGYANLAAMSIDLGMENVKIGLVKPGVPMEIVLNSESKRKTANVVGFKDGERFFGDAAMNLGIKKPVNLITFYADLIGKPFDHPVVQKYKEEFPHLTISAHPERNSTVFDIDGHRFDAETILAMTLWNAKEQAKLFADQVVNDAVICVPSYFNDAERLAVATAAKIAGIHIISFVHDGAAAGLNYAVFRWKGDAQKNETVLIYDVGSAKIAATIVRLAVIDGNATVTPLSVGSTRDVGGRDITRRLRDHLLAAFKAKHKTKKEITENPRAMAKLWKEAERVKQVLSANTDINAQIESLFEDIDFKVKVNRDLIESFVAELKDQYLEPLKEAFTGAELTPADVDTVVLMGAGTRVPAVQQYLKEFVGDKELSRFLNTDEAIALGAVYEAARVSKGFRVKDIRLADPIALPNHTMYNEAYIKEATAILANYEKHERQKQQREAALSTLEALAFDIALKLDESDANFLREADPVDVEAIRTEVVALKTWLEDESYEADTNALVQRRNQLTALIRTKDQNIRKKKEAAKREKREMAKYLQTFPKWLKVYIRKAELKAKPKQCDIKDDPKLKMKSSNKTKSSKGSKSK